MKTTHTNPNADQSVQSDFLAQEIWVNNFAYCENPGFLPVVAHLDDGRLVGTHHPDRFKYSDGSTNPNYLFIDAGLGDIDPDVVIPPIVGGSTTSQPGNHGVRVDSKGETLLEWVARIESCLHNKVIALTIREHSGCEGDEWEYETIPIIKYDYERLRRRIRDALNKTTDFESLVKIALELKVKL